MLLGPELISSAACTLMPYRASFCLRCMHLNAVSSIFFEVRAFNALLYSLYFSNGTYTFAFANATCAFAPVD
jgi:hypothetical protein